MKRISLNKAYNYLLFVLLFLVSWQIFAQNKTDENLGTLTKNRRMVLASEHFDAGMAYFHEGFHKQAIEEFEFSISLNPTNHLYYYFKGLTYERLEDYEQAFFNFNASLLIKEDFSEALFSRALLYFNAEAYENAISDLRILISLPQSETEAVYFRGIKYGENDSQTGFNDLVTMTDQMSDLLYHMGLCFYKMEIIDSSIYYYSKAILSNPNDENVYINRGLAYLEQGQTDRAKLDFENALSLNPDNSLASLNLSLTSHTSHDAEIKELTQLIKKNNNFPLAYAQRAYIYYLSGNLKYARMDYDSAILLDPDNYAFYLERGLILEKENKLQEAILNYQAALNLESTDYRSWLNLGNAYYKLMDYTLSLECYDEAILLNSSEGSIYYNRALCLYNLNDITTACQDMKKALNLKFKSATTFLVKYCK